LDLFALLGKGDALVGDFRVTPGKSDRRRCLFSYGPN
jgi:hypothetical protein